MNITIKNRGCVKNVDLYIKQLHFQADLGIQNWTLTMKTVYRYDWENCGFESQESMI